MHAPREFLTEAAQVTPGWLTDALRAGGALRVGCVESINVASSNRMVVSTAMRLRPVYSPDAPKGAPTRLFLKFSRPDLGKEFGKDHNENEVIFYNRLAPLMKDPPFIRCYRAAYCSTTGSSYVLLEDVCATHHQPPQPLPPQEINCRRAVESLARLHASWWQDPRLGTEFGRVEPGDALFPKDLRPHVVPFLDFLGDRLLPSRRRTYERLLGSATPRWSNPANPGGLTLIHGDAHSYNFFYPRNPQTHRVLMFDWHRWCVDVGPRDLAHNIARSWYSSRRAELEEKLVRHYHHTLQESGVSNYPWDQCWHDYRKSVIRNLIVPVRSWALKRRVSLWWAVLERVCCAYEELGCDELVE